MMEEPLDSVSTVSGSLCFQKLLCTQSVVSPLLNNEGGPRLSITPLFVTKCMRRDEFVETVRSATVLPVGKRKTKCNAKSPLA